MRDEREYEELQEKKIEVVNLVHNLKYQLSGNTPLCSMYCKRIFRFFTTTIIVIWACSQHNMNDYGSKLYKKFDLVLQPVVGLMSSLLNLVSISWSKAMEKRGVLHKPRWLDGVYQFLLDVGKCLREPYLTMMDT